LTSRTPERGDLIIIGSPPCRFACNGGCPKDRFAISPYGESGQHYLCPGYKAFFHHVERPMQRMAQLLRDSRAPDKLMQTYAVEDSRRARNDSCTCGNGKKWKRCHGARQGLASSRSS
jgi:uncharacterized protein